MAIGTEGRSMINLRVGGASAPMTDARIFVHRYLNTPSEHWAYPAYDGYPGGPTSEITEQDLFGPALLNAGLRSLRSYDEFLEQLPELNIRLKWIDYDASLADAEFDIEPVVEVIGLLDDFRLYDVSLTKLSKVVHRKRPSVFPLYDDHLRRCYQVIDAAPVPPVKGRSWRDFARLWLSAVHRDLVDQLEAWAELAQLTPAGGPMITQLRALDIVGWRLGQPARQKWNNVVRKT